MHVEDMVRGLQHRLSFSQNSHLTSGLLLQHYPHSWVPREGSSPAHGAVGRAAGREVTGELDSSDGATWTTVGALHPPNPSFRPRGHSC